MRRSITTVLTVLALAATAPGAALAQAQPYVIQTRADGGRYLASEVFIGGRTLDLSQNMLDNAVHISDEAVGHVATGLTLPRTEGDCSLQWLTGLPQSGGFVTFDRGGRGYYACTGGAPAFVVLSFEADISGLERVPGDPGRALAVAGMALSRDPAAAECQETIAGAVRRVTCRAVTAWNGEQVTEIGLYAGQGDTFLKLNAACLPADCEATAATLDRLATALGADRLPADAHPRD